MRQQLLGHLGNAAAKMAARDQKEAAGAGRYRGARGDIAAGAGCFSLTLTLPLDPTPNLPLTYPFLYPYPYP